MSDIPKFNMVVYYLGREILIRGVSFPLVVMLDLRPLANTLLSTSLKLLVLNTVILLLPYQLICSQCIYIYLHPFSYIPKTSAVV